MTSNNPIPHHRRRNNEVPDSGGDAIGAAAATAAAIAARPEHAAALLETEKNTVASFPKYRNMLAEFMRWLQRDYPDLYDEIGLLVEELDLLHGESTSL